MIPPLYDPEELYLVLGCGSIQVRRVVPGAIFGQLVDWWHPSMVEDMERHGRMFPSCWAHYFWMEYRRLSGAWQVVLTMPVPVSPVGATRRPGWRER